MASERTFVTELATAVGLSGRGELEAVLAERPAVFSNLGDAEWDELLAIQASGRCR